MSVKNTVEEIIKKSHYSGVKLKVNNILGEFESKSSTRPWSKKKWDSKKRRIQQILKVLVSDKNSPVVTSKCDDDNSNWNELCYYCEEDWNENTLIKDPVIALMITILGRVSRKVLPNAYNKYFDFAEEEVDSNVLNNEYKKWSKKFHVERLPQDKKEPVSMPDDEDARYKIYDSLLREKCFTADYLGSAHDFTLAGKWQPKKNALIGYRYYPFGLILREHMVYLVAKSINAEYNIESPDKHFALHQFTNVEQTNITAGNGEKIFHNYIHNHIIDEPINPLRDDDDNIISINKIQLELYVSEAVAEYLKENTPYELEVEKTNWYSEKYPEKLRDGWSCFVAKDVPDTEQLRRWILSLQPHVEVLEPEELRESLKNIAEKSYTMYEDILTWNEENNQ
ncbi:WYL domain-containing protein [Candidatus Woesearchaeota archaeon]|nr:WYL domain-containing protein [Candidatus Woesearchaeota archaeon]